jgi:hypothetical protein
LNNKVNYAMISVFVEIYKNVYFFVFPPSIKNTATYGKRETGGRHARTERTVEENKVA